MKGKGISAIKVALALMVVAVAGTSLAQMQPGSGPGSRMRAPRYDPSTVMTAKGTIQEVQQITGRRGWGGTHLTLKTEAGTFDVHLGPASFLKEEGFSFEKGDEVEVKGSRVAYQKGEAIIAREVKKGDKTLKLRDEKGYPVWSRRGRGARSPAR
jgi:DNA/RNA endonuclease YhcR with UshA esterase domain